MKRSDILTGAYLGAAVTAPLIGLQYLTYQLAGLPFTPFNIFDWMTRVLPGGVVTFGIDLMIDTMRWLRLDVADIAKTAERIMAVALLFSVGLFAAVAFSTLIRARRIRASRTSGLLLGAVTGLPTAAISAIIGQARIDPALGALWVLATFLAWGATLGWACKRLEARESTAETSNGARRAVRIGRRKFLIRLGSATAVITVAGAGLGSILATGRRRRLALSMEAHQVESGTSDLVFPNANDPVMPAPGTRPEYTPLKDHYAVSVRTEPTVIDGSTWTLPIMGKVDRSLMLTLDDIRNNYESLDQYVTLACISGRVGTSLIGTTQWTGVSLQDLLDDAGLQPGAKYLHISAGDGFHETVAVDLIRADPRIMLTYAWDGVPLTVEHGFPLRIYLPDRYGMKQPKWITAIEVAEEDKPGYWVERNWDEVAQINATSVIDTVAANAVYESGGEMLVPIGGIAHAGARGISKVELRVDGGEWVEAKLRAPLSETTWVIWRYDWPFTPDSHEFEVRCYEGDGTLQIAEQRPARPSGSTGIHSKQVTL